MLQLLNLKLLGVAALIILACEQTHAGIANDTPETEPSAGASNTPAEAVLTLLPASEFTTIQWTELMPNDDLEAPLNPPNYVTDVEDGSFEDQIRNQIHNAIGAANDDRYQQALSSTRIIPEMDGEAIRIPGFIVPLEFDDDQTITQFFLVPFFGACIHLPPPPPNQIIFVESPDGIQLDALYNPFWISGILKTSTTQNDVATAAYSLRLQYFEEYEE